MTETVEPVVPTPALAGPQLKGCPENSGAKRKATGCLSLARAGAAAKRAKVDSRERLIMRGFLLLGWWVWLMKPSVPMRLAVGASADRADFVLDIGDPGIGETQRPFQLLALA